MAPAVQPLNNSAGTDYMNMEETREFVIQIASDSDSWWCLRLEAKEKEKHGKTGKIKEEMKRPMEINYKAV